MNLLQEQKSEAVNMLFIVMFPMVGGFIVGLIYIADKNYPVGVALLSLGVMCTFIFAYGYFSASEARDDIEVIELKIDALYEQQIQERKNLIMEMDCPTLRLSTISIMETDQEGYIENLLDWQRDYYNLKCETPLRDEVLKLQ
jgi:hypothetical protein